MTRSSKGPLSALGVALVAMLALGAFFGSASASAATQHWHGHIGGTRLLEKTPTEVVAEDTTSTQIKFYVAGAKLTIDCGSLDAGGTIENPSGGANGTLSGVSISFGGCAVTEPTGLGCTVPSTIETNQMKGEATTFEGSPAVKYSPAEGSIVTTFTVSGNKCTFWGGSKTITGSFIALYAGIEDHWAITDLSSAGLAYGGIPAVKLNTDYQLNSKAGEAVAVGADIAPPGQHWYLGAGSKEILAEGSATGYSSLEGSMSSTISATITGVKFTMQCGGSSSAEGAVENPVGGGAGTASGTIDFAGCTVSEPTGGKCSVDGGGTTSLPLSGLATEAGGDPAATFSPAEKTTIATFTISGASCPWALKGNKSLTGSLTGVPDPFGNYVFSGDEGLKFYGVTATFSAQATLETSAGKRLVLAP